MNEVLVQRVRYLTYLMEGRRRNKQVTRGWGVVNIAGRPLSTSANFRVFGDWGWSTGRPRPQMARTWFGPLLGIPPLPLCVDVLYGWPLIQYYNINIVPSHHLYCAVQYIMNDYQIQYSHLIFHFVDILIVKWNPVFNDDIAIRCRNSEIRPSTIR